LCQATLNNHTEAVRRRLKEELPIMRKDEQWLREKVLIKEGIWKCLHFDSYEGKDMEVKECAICKYDCYLSAVACPCSDGKLVCLRHSDKLCKCPPGRRVLLFRWRLVDIDEMMKRVGCEPFQMIREDMDVIHEINPLQTHFLGSGRSGVQKIIKSKEKLNGVSKPAIRKLARRAGVRRMKGVEYGKDELNEAMFIIEKIIEQRTANGKQEYLLKWEGFPESENTWHASEDLCCPGLVEAFENKHKKNPITQVKRSSTRSHKGRNMSRARM